MVIGIDLQDGEHDSIDDARAALQLYIRVRKDWESQLHIPKQKTEQELPDSKMSSVDELLDLGATERSASFVSIHSSGVIKEDDDTTTNLVTSSSRGHVRIHRRSPKKFSGRRKFRKVKSASPNGPQRIKNRGHR